MEELIRWDTMLFEALNGAWPAADRVMWWVSEPTAWTPLYVVVLIMLWKRANGAGAGWSAGRGRNYAVKLVILGLCIATTDAVSARFTKPYFARLRPSHTPELQADIHLVTPSGETTPYRGGQYGFVSSHAANHMGIAVLVGLWLGGGWLVGLVFWAVLIGYSRIHLGVHFPGDVLGGLILGAVAGGLWWRIGQRFVRA